MDQKQLRIGVGIVSAAIFGFILWLVYLRPVEGVAGAAASPLPAINALCNSLCVVCLLAGYRAIRAGNRRLHMTMMLSALLCSALFLVGYIAHHAMAGDTPFPGQGTVRVVYLFILASHVLLTMAALPMILTTLLHAASGRFADHKRIARRTLPVWLYVSVTGVVVFLMLRAWS